MTENQSNANGMVNGKRIDGRVWDAPREVEIITGFQKNPAGSVLYRCGGTRVLISASISEQVPRWLKDTGSGWVTAEYAMHPCANPTRNRRDRSKGKINGRAQEIQRLIARSLRAAVDMDKLGEQSITVDCDVLDADGGTRTASITGGFIALAMAIHSIHKVTPLPKGTLRCPVAAISCGLVSDEVLVDLCYTEDSAAEVDLNVVATADNRIIEIQGTAEGAPVKREHFNSMIDAGASAMGKLVEMQMAALSKTGIDISHLLA